MKVESTRTVGEVAAGLPAATRLFEKLGIDYCCGGRQTLASACTTAGVSYENLAQSLAELSAVPPNEEQSWTNASLPELTHHVVAKHHAFIRSESPRLQSLITKVVGVHGGRHPELKEVQAIFSDVSQELAMHMMKEEQILFPAIIRMEQFAADHAPATCFGTIQNPIRMMMMEHDSAGEALSRLREITSDYMVPADGCVSYRTLYQALAEFEADLHQHVHLENNILFPRAVELEKAR